MSSSPWLPSKVVPAQLAFLAIYNPSLGPTDETFADQCVFWYSRAAQEGRAAAKKSGRGDAAAAERAAREEENEKLRQIGLAQGIVGFARSFADGEPVDAIETEKSRVVLHELERGWWVLASIDLTRLPAVTHSPPEPTKRGAGAANVESKPAVEYSSREVSPPALLTQQLLQAHCVFQLHHGPSLAELFARLSRDKFCNALDRFWARFCKTWDVMLHGNPAADVFSGLKVASGGELGFGVGEEEWGSGEREVLEDLADRTEGLVDLVVSRFGEPATVIASDDSTLPESEALPWMGGGNYPIASDGVVFGGMGSITRPSLRNISLWMRQIYTYGEYAYGVRDNVSRVRHKRRRHNPPELPKDMNGSARGGPRSVLSTERRQRVQRRRGVTQQDEEVDPLDLALFPPEQWPQVHGRDESPADVVASIEDTPPLPAHNHPGIPPPIVSAAERALEKATQQADDYAEKEAKTEAEAEDAGSGSTLGIPDQYMKYLTLGLSELGRTNKAKRPPLPERVSTGDSSRTLRPQQPRSNATSDTTTQAAPHKEVVDEDGPTLTHMAPMPDGETLKAKIATQRRRENKGHFVIGLKGDLDSESPPEGGDDDDAGNVTDGSTNDSGGSRIILRTIHVEVPAPQRDLSVEDEGISAILRRKLRASQPNSAPESIVITSKNFQRVRVVIYVHRPFVYCFLFEDRTDSLSYMAFFQELHRALLPIHQPLLSSTSVVKVAQRIESSHNEPDPEDAPGGAAASVRSAGTNRLPTKGGSGASGMRPIFDLIYDPRLLTVHTSIPNIPDPGTPAAEGIVSGTSNTALMGWTRVEALNVHSQILNTLHSIGGSARGKGGRSEIERTSKTSRGWWVVWMRVPPSALEPEGGGGGTRDRSRAGNGGNGNGEGDGNDTETYMDGSEGPESTNTSRYRDGGAKRARRDGDDGADLARTAGTPTPSATLFAAYQRPRPGRGRDGREEQDMSRMAFLVRKSAVEAGAGGAGGAASSSGSRAGSGASGGGGVWSSLAWRPGGGVGGGRTVEERAGGVGAGWGPGALAGGVGIDARRYVEGLLSLNR
ncbi:hypothetical protein LTR36_005051 [Oleoguttula mirabilis]|uniref:CCZ1/INTU/HSP4 first Longin domain-containing protein n=1 Tax=Oleoguttula mirabilis TaxID=1507867 RepID=A0AAV9JVW1_9PEZI|nr:hypothetical protein LTR36_005051 [Oleoguttula mirabilis]